MKTYLPKWKIAALEPAQDRLRSKIGGLPWGLPPKKWPRCCGHPQKLLAQFCHEPPMLDLGGDGNVLHVFQCLNLDDSGNTAFILHRSELGEGLTRIKDWDHKPEYGGELIGEFWLDRYTEEDDGIPRKRLADFFDYEKLQKLEEDFSDTISKNDWFDGRRMTRFGGTPRWTGNGPMGFPDPPFEFLFQIHTGLHFDGKMPSADRVGCYVEKYSLASGKSHRVLRAEPRKVKKRLNAPWGIGQTVGWPYFIAEFTNLASDGTLYVFINRKRKPHKVAWFYNR